MSDEAKKTYAGGCHCGAVRFEVDAPPSAVQNVMACNCSMCGASGAWMAFLPGSDFRLLQGEGSMRDYQFGKKHIHHPFCTVCGLKPFSHGLDPESGGKVMSVNVRCIDGMELRELTPTWYDGRAL